MYLVYVGVGAAPGTWARVPGSRGSFWNPGLGFRIPALLLEAVFSHFSLGGADLIGTHSSLVIHHPIRTGPGCSGFLLGYIGRLTVVMFLFPRDPFEIINTDCSENLRVQGAGFE